LGLVVRKSIGLKHIGRALGDELRFEARPDRGRRGNVNQPGNPKLQATLDDVPSSKHVDGFKLHYARRVLSHEPGQVICDVAPLEPLAEPRSLREAHRTKTPPRPGPSAVSGALIPPLEKSSNQMPANEPAPPGHKRPH